MSILSKENILLEKYVGGSKEFQTIEKELSKIIKIIRSEYKTLYDEYRTGASKPKTTTSDLNQSDSTKLIEELFKKIFSLKNFSIVWVSYDIPNAITPCKTFGFLDKNFKKDVADGNPTLSITTVIDIALIVYYDLDEKELLSVMLHEIGHNFDTSLNVLLSRISLDLIVIPGEQTLSIWSSLAVRLGLLGLFDKIDMPNAIGDGIRQIDEFLMKYARPIHDLIKLYNSLKNNFMIKRIVNAYKLFVKKYSINFKNMLSPEYIFGYSVERHADDFVSEYGYGQYLATFFDKLEKNKNNIIVRSVRDVPLLNWAYDFADLGFNLLSMVVSSHPSNQNRIKSIIVKLRKEYNRPEIDPKVKQELKEQLDEVEDFYYNKYLKLSENDNNKRVFSWIFKVAVEELFDGQVDARELLYIPQRIK